ncbi:amidohydrolase [Sneathiella sp. P13V-1]|uniref:M20 aminoacylase family protein n=1 Tax=Sneathiella sp. P13V-1 TaxID=2697366 RepID=UPI00187B53A7|nr:M20 aminoacylase family protein [Sneathiella sp. P13V-1]MBE7636710.1 amidohydrolase [Sneathiella sp. P13V-1]
MKILPEIEAIHAEMTEWRHKIHMHPETAFEEYKTADFVAEKLESFGLEVHRGLAKTGVVGTLKAGTGNRAIGLRADMDALDLQELNDFAHKSQIDGKMHGCGHDGHTVMLLGAAKYLSESKNFDGTVHFIFQPAEENVAGGRVMIKDGLFEKFPVESVYGMHNMPGFEVGEFAVRTGPIMASADFFEAKITGVGGHGAFPHLTVDPIVIASEVIGAWQKIVSRNVDPLKSAVITVGQIHGGHTGNVIPEEVVFSGTTRAFDPEVQNMIESHMERMLKGICDAYGATCEFTYDRRYAPTINTPDETAMAILTAQELVGEAAVDKDVTPVMGAEDFSWMLQERPGCYIMIANGAGEGSCHVHNPKYDFNDQILPLGATYWSRLTERILTKDAA